MRIAIEGIDNTGKSTFIKSSPMDGHCIVHTNTKPTKEYYEKLLSLDDVIFDRFCLGDKVYNKPRRLTDADVDELVAQLDLLIIVVPENNDVLARNFSLKGETPHGTIAHENLNFITQAMELKRRHSHVIVVESNMDNNRGYFTHPTLNEEFTLAEFADIVRSNIGRE